MRRSGRNGCRTPDYGDNAETPAPAPPNVPGPFALCDVTALRAVVSAGGLTLFDVFITAMRAVLTLFRQQGGSFRLGASCRCMITTH